MASAMVVAVLTICSSNIKFIGLLKEAEAGIPVKEL
jgi:hypothetical protein